MARFIIPQADAKMEVELMLLARLFTGSFSPRECGRTTKMKCRDVSLAAVLLSAVLSGLLATNAQAKKGGGGKPPPEPTPPGQVFYDYWDDGVTVGYAVDADGNNPIVTVPGTPSYELHDGHRWFLQWGENSGAGKEIIAVRDDNVGEPVPLTDDPNLYIPYSVVQPVWVPGSSDSEISFIGMDVVTKQSSVFKVGVEFDSGTPIPTAPTPAWSVPTVYWEPGAYGPDASRHSWSDDGNLLVYSGTSPEHAGIHVADLSAETETTVAQGSRPSISPDGTAIAFVTFPGFDLSVVNTDGTGEMVLVESKHRGDKLTRHFSPFWSPDSNHLIWQRRYEHMRWHTNEVDIWRISRDGGNPMNLTTWVDFDPSGGSNPWVTPTGWRVDGGGTGASLSAAVPEPASVVLLIVGSFGVLGFHRRRRPACGRDASQDQANFV
jgi:hypothetical protein